MRLVDSINDTNSKAKEVGEKYLKTSYEYYKLKIFQQLTISVSLVFKAFAIGALLLLGIVFLAIALAILIGESLDNYALGFLWVGFIFLILSLIVFLFRKHLNNLIIKKLSKTFFN
ncbi:hypothetical protein SAMN05428642_101616 [Flaviramulus basaltis]|uniref:Holin-X, holin superfamily III n=1 Tax=Flaviramulus basaltis TaxID=369401 RepID=A0A1K2IC88_9FLAO|nr:hypothetical protein [Flaviramulus basaltis]SFZ89882.1 hypothetical protein SAMN05428642_101616 [Flaviramulus basaltis]